MKLKLFHEELIAHDDEWDSARAVEVTATIVATDEQGRRWEVKRILRMRPVLEKTQNAVLATLDRHD